MNPKDRERLIQAMKDFYKSEPNVKSKLVCTSSYDLNDFIGAYQLFNRLIQSNQDAGHNTENLEAIDDHVSAEESQSNDEQTEDTSLAAAMDSMNLTKPGDARPSSASTKNPDRQRPSVEVLRDWCQRPTDPIFVRKGRALDPDKCSPPLFKLSKEEIDAMPAFLDDSRSKEGKKPMTAKMPAGQFSRPTNPQGPGLARHGRRISDRHLLSIQRKLEQARLAKPLTGADLQKLL